ncbi:hypothetical protein DsansV1_C09g0088991 [Dioscorea sansibarensis]
MPLCCFLLFALLEHHSSLVPVEKGFKEIMALTQRFRARALRPMTVRLGQRRMVRKSQAWYTPTTKSPSGTITKSTPTTLNSIIHDLSNNQKSIICCSCSCSSNGYSSSAVLLTTTHHPPSHAHQSSCCSL